MAVVDVGGRGRFEIELAKAAARMGIISKLAEGAPVCALPQELNLTAEQVEVTIAELATRGVVRERNGLVSLTTRGLELVAAHGLN